MEWKVKLKELSQSIRWPYDVNNLSDKLIGSLHEDQIRSVLKDEYAMLYFSDWHLIFNLINNGQGIAYAYYYSQTILLAKGVFVSGSSEYAIARSFYDQIQGACCPQ